MDRILLHMTHRAAGALCFAALVVLGIISFSVSAVSWPGLLILLLAVVYGVAVATGGTYTENLIDTGARFLAIIRDVANAPSPAPPVVSPATSTFGPPPPSDSDRAGDPATPPQVLMELAAERPDLRPTIAGNPSTYPALVEWLAALGDPAVDAVLSRRSV